MKTNRSCKIVIAGLFAAAWLFTQLTTQASLVGPYTADSNTLHLWHMDASAVPIPDAVATGGINLVNLANGATLGANSYPGFGSALNTVDGGQNGITTANRDAFLAASSTTPPTAASITLADSTTGAFTFEALVWIGFNPGKNFGPTGNNRASPCQIICGDGNANANRVFQFRLTPIGCNAANNNTTVNLEFNNLHLGATTQLISFAVPTTGADAIVSNNWYHVAVTYNGTENTANNLTLYWTLLDPNRTNASVLGTAQLTFDLPVAPCPFTIGNSGRSTIAINNNFLGLVDEVRISNLARGSNAMMFSASAPFITAQPTDAAVGAGQGADLGVLAGGLPVFYQWRLYGTNLPGATQSAYSIAAAQLADAGPYDVVITNDYGAVTSVVATLTVVASSPGVTVWPQELAQKNDWIQRNLLAGTNAPPFSFNYDGLSSSTLLGSWVRAQTDTILDATRTRHILTWTNAGSPLQVQCVAVEYSDYPVVEWTVYLKNIGTANTPLVQNIQGLDTSFLRTSGPEFVLNGNQGDFQAADSYEPLQFTLPPNTVKNFAPPGTGKSCDGPNGWPYWNLQVPGGGAIVAVGWPGQWAGSFTRDAATSLRVQAGQELTSLYLAPGEQIRTPLIALLFWKGTDRVRSQNLWRRWYLADNMPRVNGQLLSPQLQIQVGGDDTNNVGAFLQAGIVPDLCWRDAGGGYTWYPSDNGPYTGDWAWLNTGTWEVDTNRYPAGFKPFSDWIHAAGMKFVLWFEPERVGAPANTWLGINHPEWLLQPGSVGLILDEGNPAVFDWMTNHFDTLIKANGVDWYREDMNGAGPCPSWRAHDASNRQGITENFYVQNHLAYWDALLAMNPGLRIDSCASGGRRNDLESMRRAVPLLRSDFQFPGAPGVVEGNQGHTYGLSAWLPFQGTGVYQTDVYSFRSFYLASFGMGGLTPETTAAQQQAHSECKRIAPCLLYGDYYPLTPYSLATTVWMAWQFDRADTGEGCVQIFRRPDSAVASMQFPLQGLNPTQAYQVQDFDRGVLGYYTGGQLMATGLVVQLASRQSAILYYTAAPVAVWASASRLAGPAPLAVQFSATAVSTNGGPLSYAWTFGDGSSSTNQNPAHTYSSGGRYVAQVTVQDGQGQSASAQVSISVFGGARKMKISFPGYNQAETLSNFPALVVLGPTNGFAYSQVASANGWDLLFLSADETQELNYEIESWNTNGASYVWVQLPQLAANTYIWACWGDPNRASSPAPYLANGAVWANGYAGVWHLANGVVLSGTDSTGNGNNGTVHNSAATAGVIDGAAAFDGVSAYVDVGTPTSLMTNQRAVACHHFQGAYE
jgi:alpha-galactosidase